MAAKKCQKKKKLQADFFFCILNVYDPKTHLIKAPSSLD